jgi:hypothetical protein
MDFSKYISKLPFVITSLVDAGRCGNIYAIKNDLNRVVKITKIHNNNFENFTSILNFLTKNKSGLYAKIFEHGLLEVVDNYVLYYYIMEKYNYISDDEYKVFDSILSHRDFNVKKKFSMQELDEVLLGLSKGLDFDLKKVKCFYNLIELHPILHKDLHSRNIMKDNEDFVLIDLDFLQFKRKVK